MRRLLAVAAATAVLLLAWPATATAEVDAGVTSPAPDATISSPVELSVRVTLDCLDECDGDPGDDTVAGVTARLTRPGDEAATPPDGGVELECVEGCSSEEQTWGGVTFEPSSGAPFSERDVCNGGWQVTAEVSYEERVASEAETLRRSVPVTVSAPPTAPTGLTVDGGAGSATVSWRAAPQPDVTGYRVQRQADDGWVAVDTVGPSTTSHTEEGVDAGRVSYRVQALRADGLVDGEPVTECGADTGRDLATVSAAHDGMVEPAPTPSPTGSGSPTGSASPTDGAGDGAGGGEGGGSGGSGDGGSGGDGAGGSTGGSGGPDTEPGGTREQAEAPELSAPQDDGSDGGAASPEPSPRFYGEDLGFSEQLDYGDVEGGGTPTPAATESPDAVVVQDLRSAGTSGLERYLDPERFAVPAAFGLLLVAAALHLRRWMNAASG